MLLEKVKNIFSNKKQFIQTYTTGDVMSKIMALPEGVQVHGAVVKMGLEGEIFVSNSLIHFYEECGRVDLGRKMFEGMLERNVASWTSLINGYAGRLFLFSFKWLRLVLNPIRLP